MYISINHVQDSLARQEKHPQIEDYIRNALLPSDLKFVNFKHFWIFYTQRTIVKNDETYTLHFLRTITAEKVFFRRIIRNYFFMLELQG